MKPEKYPKLVFTPWDSGIKRCNRPGGWTNPEVTLLKRERREFAILALVSLGCLLVLVVAVMLQYGK